MFLFRKARDIHHPFGFVHSKGGSVLEHRLRNANYWRQVHERVKPEYHEKPGNIIQEMNKRGLKVPKSEHFGPILNKQTHKPIGHGMGRAHKRLLRLINKQIK